MGYLKGKAILLNAPKGAGKDTLGKALSERTGTSLREYKAILYDRTAEQFNVPVDVVRGLNEDRERKEVPTNLFTIPVIEFVRLTRITKKYDDPRKSNFVVPLSVREALIYTSEVIIKPQHGKTYFGTEVARHLDFDNGTIITDSGFDEEVIPIVDACGVENVIIVKFTRNGTTFDGDSRTWLTPPEGCAVITATNDGDIDSFVNFVEEKLKIICNVDEGC